MRKKYIASPTQTATITELFRIAKALTAAMSERRAFLDKQINDLNDDAKLKDDEMKKQLVTELVRIGAIPSDTPSNRIALDDDNQIFLLDRDPQDCGCFACAMRRMSP